MKVHPKMQPKMSRAIFPSTRLTSLCELVCCPARFLASIAGNLLRPNGLHLANFNFTQDYLYEKNLSTIKNSQETSARFSEPDAHQERSRHLESTSPSGSQTPHSGLIVSGWQLKATHSESSCKETFWEAPANSVFLRIQTC